MAIRKIKTRSQLADAHIAMSNAAFKVSNIVDLISWNGRDVTTTVEKKMHEEIKRRISEIQNIYHNYLVTQNNGRCEEHTGGEFVDACLNCASARHESVNLFRER